ncbi:hypothetical protein SEA_ANDROMEDAS_61 [Microbacterium phage Andromedas]|uniref:Uncharacterized protein n=2 Tax=Elerivirus eleri TaxID=2560589 RepID=A0A345MJ83_9CAUD|nr:hypothetical protein SEA_COLACORTA_61 [Microbacterium phage ColaCorta]AXH70739.1 hypothetical protein SEA_ANDROMEDAS_61 [Microbacterium phage Andromedas]
MRLVAERIEATRALYDDLEGRERVKRSDLEAVELLLEEEHESKDKSERVSQSTNNPVYRKSMQTAAANSRIVINLLGEALDYLHDRNTAEAAKKLLEVAELRAGRKAVRKSTSLQNLYVQYQMETDSGFHKWLRDNGHDAAHLEATKSVAKTPQRRTQPQKPVRRKPKFSDGKSNRPEDY